MSDNAPSSLPTDLGMTPGYAPPQWDNVQIPRMSEPTRNSPPSECCNGRCKYTSGMCTCPGDCPQGCECAEHDYHEDFAAKTGGLTFATSGERGSCCLGASRRDIRSLESFERGSRLNLPVGPSSRHVPGVNQGLLDIPDLSRSRSSSTSSKSLPESGYNTDLSTMFITPRHLVRNGMPSSGSSSSASSTVQLRIPVISSQPKTPDGSGIDPNIAIVYATSNPDSEASSDDQQFEPYSQYHPPLDRMHL